MGKIFNKKLLLLLLIIIVIAVALIFYFKNNKQSSKEIIYEDYKILEGHSGKIEDYDSSLTVDGYQGGEDKAYYITGRITANSDKNFTLITFNLYDKKNNLLGTAVAGIKKLSKDTIYSFKATSLIERKDIEKIAYYEIKDIKLG